MNTPPKSLDFQSIVSLDTLNKMSEKTMVQHLGIQFVEVGADFLTARMPVDARTHQPYGMLHGGASVALAETLGSVAAHCAINSNEHYCVGLEINANHIRAVRDGFVLGTARPVHMGRSTQVWEIKITTENGDLVCVSRITMAILKR